jgi:hypothetical protein
MKRAHTVIAIEPSRLLIGLGGKLHQWWLYGSGFRIILFTCAFYWAATAPHPIAAVILGVALADFVVMTQGRGVLRFFVAWFMLSAFFFR